MEIKDIKSESQKLAELVGGWDRPEEITAIERDLALEKLRALYDAVRFCAGGNGSEFAEAGIEGDAVVMDVEIDLGEVLSLDDMTDLEFAVEQTPAEAYAEHEPAAETAPEVVAEPEPETTPEVVSDPIVEPQPVKTINSLFGEEIESGHRRRQRVIMSLYGTEAARPAPAAAPESEPVSEFTPAAAPESIPESESELIGVFAAETPAEMSEPVPTEHVIEEVQPDPEIIAVEVERVMESEMTATGLVLGEVMNHDVQTLADTIAPPRDMASELRRAEPVGDLHRAVGINDKFLMIRDLFDGDGAKYDKALDVFNGFDNLDDCVIYIAENYAWNSNSDGAKLLMELLERKFA